MRSTLRHGLPASSSVDKYTTVIVSNSPSENVVSERNKKVLTLSYRTSTMDGCRTIVEVETITIYASTAVFSQEYRGILPKSTAVFFESINQVGSHSDIRRVGNYR